MFYIVLYVAKRFNISKAYHQIMVNTRIIAYCSQFFDKKNNRVVEIYTSYMRFIYITSNICSCQVLFIFEKAD